jgi:hypothetical protein
MSDAPATATETPTEVSYPAPLPEPLDAFTEFASWAGSDHPILMAPAHVGNIVVLVRVARGPGATSEDKAKAKAVVTAMYPDAPPSAVAELIDPEAATAEESTPPDTTPTKKPAK